MLYKYLLFALYRKTELTVLMILIWMSEFSNSKNFQTQTYMEVLHACPTSFPHVYCLFQIYYILNFSHRFHPILNCMYSGERHQHHHRPSSVKVRASVCVFVGIGIRLWAEHVTNRGLVLCHPFPIGSLVWPGFVCMQSRCHLYHVILPCLKRICRELEWPWFVSTWSVVS